MAAGVPLVEVGRRLLEWWSPAATRAAGQDQGGDGARLMPPDLQQYQDFKQYRDEIACRPAAKEAAQEIEDRLAWEATSEFGLMQTHGRTMETAGSSCLGWDENADRRDGGGVCANGFRGIDPALDGSDRRAASAVDLRDSLYRYRVRGASGSSVPA